MKRMLIPLSISCALGLLSLQAYGAERERTLASQKPRDCSKMDNAKKKARCEEVNNAMKACTGKKAGEELTNCLMGQRKKK